MEERVPYNSTALSEELKQRAEVELNEYEATREVKIMELRELLKGESNLKLPEDDSFILMFLRARKFDVPRAAELCKNYYKLWNHRILKSFDYNSLVRKLEEGEKMGVLPFRDPSGCRITYFEAGKWDPEKNPFQTALQAMLIPFLTIMQSPVTQIVGFKVINDYTGFTMRQLLSISYRDLLEMMIAVKNALPGRYKEVHIVNESKLFRYLWICVQPVLSKKLKTRYFFHGSNYEELHKRFPPDILPETCGGSMGAYNNKEFVENLKRMTKTFEDMRKYGYQMQDCT